MNQDKPKKKTIILKKSDYQPSKAELKRKHKIKATPEELAKAVMQDVDLKFVK